MYAAAAPLHPVSTAPSCPVATVPSRPVATVPMRPVATVPSRPVATAPSRPVATVLLCPDAIALPRSVMALPLHPPPQLLHLTPTRRGCDSVLPYRPFHLASPPRLRCHARQRDRVRFYNELSLPDPLGLCNANAQRHSITLEHGHALTDTFTEWQAESHQHAEPLEDDIRIGDWNAKRHPHCVKHLIAKPHDNPFAHAERLWHAVTDGQPQALPVTPLR